MIEMGEGNEGSKVQPPSLTSRTEINKGMKRKKKRRREKEKEKRENKLQALMIDILVSFQHKVDDLTKIVVAVSEQRLPTTVTENHEKPTSNRALRFPKIHVFAN